MPEGGSKINWTWVMVGGAAVIVVVILIMKSGSTTGPASNSTSTSTSTGTSSTDVTANAGTPTNNNSLFGFTDPATGIQWILNSATEAMVALPNGSGLPATYTAGTTLLPSTAVVPMNIGGPTAYPLALSNWQSFMGYTNN